MSGVNYRDDYLNIHEYQAKRLLEKYGVNVLKGGVAHTPQEAEAVAKDLAGPVWVVKAQIHAGGRGKGAFIEKSAGKGGGVRVLNSVEAVQKNARQILGATLVTSQTAPTGKKVKRIYIEDGCEIEKELYLSLLVDRETSRVTLIASTEGGMDIEEVAAKSPEKIQTIAIDPLTGMLGYHARKIAFGLGLEGAQVKSAVKLLISTYTAFVELDASLLEINPLVITKDGNAVALDAKMDFDDNALYRHQDIENLRDEDEQDAAELEAQRHDLNYIKLDGRIGCMVNGAGLAMATMDIIKLYGSEPANFLDVGGGATKERVTMAFKIILSDPNVEGILVNIFGGIMRCDVIAEGVIAAAKEVHLNVPLVVRLEGTNVDLGKKILSESGLPIVSGKNLADAAEKIVKAVREAG